MFSAYWAGHKKDAAANWSFSSTSCPTSPIRTARRSSCRSSPSSPDGTEDTVEGRWPGRLATAPAGRGFGSDDPIFIPDGQDAASERTVGEWSAEEKNAHSHRARAFQSLVPLLQTL